MVNINDITLQGVIIHKYVTPKIAILTINTGNATPTPNYPKVLYFRELRDKVEAEFKLGDKVTATGNIQSSRRRPDIKNQSTINIFGESIEKAKSLMEEAFGVETGKSYVPYKNELKVSGVITRIEAPTDSMIRLRMSTIKNGHQSYPTLVHFTKNVTEILNEYHVGDEVLAVGCVQTTKKNINEEVRYFENYVATEITKC